MTDFLEQHWIFQCCRDLAQPVERPGEVPVAVSLDGLLQRIGMHGKRIGAHSLQRIRDVVNRSSGQLREPNIAEQQHIRRDVADGEAGRRLLPHRTAQHDPLRAKHHSDAEPLRSPGQILVDRPGQLGAAGHRADQDRRP